MEFKLYPEDEYIKLGQLLKASGLSDSGAEAKAYILDGAVKLNGEVVYERGKKIREGDTVIFKDHIIRIIK